MKTLIYTFNTFSYMIELEEFSPFVFHKLKKDLETFKSLISSYEPELIIGIAKSSNQNSKFETKAVNIFNKSKKVCKYGKNFYNLDYPENGYESIQINRNYSDSFCNWTMYKIAQYIDGSDIKLQFIHAYGKDIEVVTRYFNLI